MSHRLFTAVPSDNRHVAYLMERQDCVVRLNHSLGDLGRREHRVRGKHAIWVLLSDLAEQKRTEPRARSSADRMSELEALQQVACLDFLSQDFEDWVNELGALGVVALCLRISATAHRCKCWTLTCEVVAGLSKAHQSRQCLVDQKPFQQRTHARLSSNKIVSVRGHRAQSTLSCRHSSDSYGRNKWPSCRTRD